jgi:hypothetical protein
MVDLAVHQLLVVQAVHLVLDKVMQALHLAHRSDLLAVAVVQARLDLRSLTSMAAQADLVHQILIQVRP